MSKRDLYIHQLCRDINKQADDRETLQTLVVELQQALRDQRYKAQAIRDSAPLKSDDPFDKIIVA
jgi:hypothetical protein